MHRQANQLHCTPKKTLSYVAANGFLENFHSNSAAGKTVFLLDPLSYHNCFVEAFLPSPLRSFINRTLPLDFLQLLSYTFLQAHQSITLHFIDIIIIKLSKQSEQSKVHCYL